MEYQVKQLEMSDLENNIETYIQTLQNLSSIPNIKLKDANRTFHEIKNQGTIIYIAINKTKGIIGSISLLLEKKFLRGGGLAGHIEDVVVRKGFEGNGIGSKLMEMATKKAKKEGCYKIILDCDQKLEGYYQNFGFKPSGSFMKIYL